MIVIYLLALMFANAVLSSRSRAVGIPNWILPVAGDRYCEMDRPISILEISDQELLARIAAADADAFAQFYDRHAAVLMGIAVRVLSNSAEAEDVLQEVALILWERAGQYDSSAGKPLSWVVALTRNKAIDRLRSLSRRPTVHPESIGEWGDEAAAEPAFHASEVLAWDELGSIRTAIDALPGEQRQAIELAFFGGLTHFEIAAQLAAPLGTVKARIRRGLIALRDVLEGNL